MLIRDRRGVEAEEIEDLGGLSDEENEKGSGRKAASQKELAQQLFPSSAVKSAKTPSTLSPSESLESAIVATLKPPSSPKGEEKELLMERKRFELRRDEALLEQQVEDARAKRKREEASDANNLAVTQSLGSFANVMQTVLDKLIKLKE